MSGAPSTLIALARGEDVLEGARAAGTLLLPRETRTLPLLDRAIPRGHEPLGGLLGGLAIAAFDLRVIGRWLPHIRALPQARQWADHAAYGLAVGIVLARRRRLHSRLTCQS